MSNVNHLTPELDSPWPHRWAVALVCATFPMIWIGGLVTTYGAGMAVPDWPNTYGYNLFLYPVQTWLFGPWKLFIEHGHRLFGTLVGMITIALCVSTWRGRPLVRRLALGALAAVIFQGALGGMRVIEDEVRLAQIHGCVGPAFFALTVALAVMTSRRWQTATAQSTAGLASIERLAVLTTLLAFGQLVVGSQLRHLTASARAADFRTALFFHLAIAAALVLHVVALAVQVHRTQRAEPSLWRPALRLAGLIVAQVGLGAATWVTKYGWPAWMSDYSFAAGHVVGAESATQALFATAHVAIGSLILATSLLLALRSARLAWRPELPAGQTRWLMGGAR